MAKITVGDGIDNYISDLNKLVACCRDDLGHAVYEGAKIIADEVKSEIDKLPIENGFAAEGTKKHGITVSQKTGLKNGFGIASMKMTGTLLNVKVGFDGYNGTKTTKWPKGVPNVVVARTLENGTSWMAKNAFVTRATNRKKATAEAAMSKALDKRIASHMH